MLWIMSGTFKLSTNSPRYQNSQKYETNYTQGVLLYQFTLIQVLLGYKCRSTSEVITLPSFYRLLDLHESHDYFFRYPIHVGYIYFLFLNCAVYILYRLHLIIYSVIQLIIHCPKSAQIVMILMLLITDFSVWLLGDSILRFGPFIFHPDDTVKGYSNKVEFRVKFH